jgi:RNA polymerase sigma-70 factor, ECF subfamily
MSESPDRTIQLLERWHAGDRDALDILIEEESDWVLSQVRRRLGTKMREKAESRDIVQEAMLEVLNYAPRFVMEDRGRFRALLAKIVENVICDQNEFFKAKRRAMSREERENTLLRIDGLNRSQTMPEAAASKREEMDWLRLGLELLDAEDREVIVLKQWDELAFPEIGERLGISESGARMRFQRALPKLAEKVQALKTGSYLDRLLDKNEPDV